MASSLTFDQLSPSRGRAAWRDAVCETFVRLECATKPEAPFHGRLESGCLSDLHVSRVQSSPQIVHRTRLAAAQADQAYVLLSIQTRGSTVIEQEGAQAVLTPGCIGFYDSARPYTLTLPKDFDQIVLHLPRQMIEATAAGGLNHMAQRLNASNPFAQAIFALAPQLLKLATAAPTALAERTANAAIELISLALASLESPLQSAAKSLDVLTITKTSPSLLFNTSKNQNSSSSTDALLWRTRELIASQLDDTNLSPEILAAQSHVSLRRLQEIFQSYGTTLSECIWEMRLEYARNCLAAPSSIAESISVVAYRSGFSDVAHFSRRFKQRYGLSPSGYRSKS
jgi:AraC family transcriptional regulator, positive regulator of tynA and feaB